MSVLTIAVLGAGPRALQYMTAISKLNEHYRFTAIVDQNLERGRSATARLGVPALYPHLRDLLAAEKPDVIIGLTPTDSMSAVLMTAARHGCHIISEIPVGITRRIGHAIAETARENGVLHEVAENVWLWPQERLKRQIVEAGALGKITHARLCYTSGSYHGFNGIRMIMESEVKRVLGYCREVETLPYLPYATIPITSRSQWEAGWFEFDNGATCLYEMPPHGGARSSQWDIEGTHGYLAGSELVLHEDGSKQHYAFESVIQTVNGEESLRCMRVDTPEPIVWENPFFQNGMKDADEIAKASILMSMHAAITTGVPLRYGAENAQRDLEIWFAVRESARLGNCWIDLPLQEETPLERQLHDAYTKKYGHDPIEGTEALLDVPFTAESVIWTAAGWL